jgi:acetamidase/formamidase
LKPVLSVKSGDFVTIETLTHHVYDDHARMIEGDPGAESVFHWTKDAKSVDRRGAGPMDASMSVAVDFGVTEVVDANWGIHAILKKAIFATTQDDASAQTGRVRRPAIPARQSRQRPFRR